MPFTAVRGFRIGCKPLSPFGVLPPKGGKQGVEKEGTVCNTSFVPCGDTFSARHAFGTLKGKAREEAMPPSNEGGLYYAKDVQIRHVELVET